VKYSLLSFCLYCPATTQTYTLSLHDALPIWDACRIRYSTGSRSQILAAFTSIFARNVRAPSGNSPAFIRANRSRFSSTERSRKRSEEHTSELQSRGHLVCRLLLEKKNTIVMR